MTRVKNFNLRDILNRNRVRRYRLKKQMLNEWIEKKNTLREFQNSIDVRVNGDTSVPLRDKLKMWASNHRITSRAINDLLTILNASGKKIGSI